MEGRLDRDPSHISFRRPRILLAQGAGARPYVHALEPRLHMLPHASPIWLILAALLALATLLMARPFFFLTPAAPTGATIKLAFGKLPLSFVPNAGQTDPAVRFQVHSSLGGTLFFTPAEVVLSLPEGTHGEPSSPAVAHRSLVVRLRFEGANPESEIRGVDPLPGVVNYYLGDDPAKWRTGVPTYAGIVYEQLYPGIDVRYDGTQGWLKGTFMVAPGADPTRIRWRYDVERSNVHTFERSDVFVDSAGNLQITLPERSHVLTELAPVAWQTVDGQRVPVSARYAIAPDGSVGFAVGSYDPTRPLAIDPTLNYSTYLGGNGRDVGYDIAVDGSGNAYVTGSTASSNFPTTTKAFDTSFNGSNDVFVTKFNSAGSGLVYSTYVGGSSDDSGSSITVDANGYAYVAGATSSGDFPTRPLVGSIGPDSFGYTANDTATFSFVDISGTGTNVGAGDDTSHGPFGLGFTFNYYGTNFTDVFLSSNGFVSFGSGSTAFTNQCPLPDSSTPNNLIAGLWDDLRPVGGGGAGNVYYQAFGAGSCPYGNYPGGCFVALWNGVAYFSGGGTTTFEIILFDNNESLVQISSAGQGGSSSTTGIEDSSGTVGLTYACNTANSIMTPKAIRFAVRPYQSSFGGGSADAFVTKLNTNGAIFYSTYLGGTGTDVAQGIAVDSSGKAYVTGITSGSFPLVNAYQSSFGGSFDAFVTKLNDLGSALDYSTYLGGSGTDFGYGIAVDSSGRAYVTGSTGSTNFPIANAYDASCGTDGNCNGGLTDAFVTRFNAAGSGLEYSTYLGGAQYDDGFSIAVDGSNNAYVTGDTVSKNFPTMNAFQPAICCGSFVFAPDAFVTKFNSSGSGLVYSTYLGGSGIDHGRGIALDSLGNAYVTGATRSTNFPLQGPLSGHDVLLGTADAFVSKLNPAGSRLDFSSYLGGSGVENLINISGSDTYLGSIAVDASGNMYLTGSTDSSDFPTANAFQGSLGGGDADAFVVKVTSVPSPTPTHTPTATPTRTDTPTVTVTPTSTNTPTATSTSTSTNTPTATSTSTSTSTATSTSTGTPTGTPTSTPTDTPTATSTATPTDTPTVTLTPTSTSTSVGPPTETSTPTPTITLTPTITPTFTPCQLADVDGDNDVDLDDVNAVVLDWRNPNFNPRHDLNGDGAVTVTDFQIVASQLGKQCA